MEFFDSILLNAGMLTSKSLEIRKKSLVPARVIDVLPACEPISNLVRYVPAYYKVDPHNTRYAWTRFFQVVASIGHQHNRSETNYVPSSEFSWIPAKTQTVLADKDLLVVTSVLNKFKNEISVLEKVPEKETKEKMELRVGKLETTQFQLSVVQPLSDTFEKYRGGHFLPGFDRLDRTILRYPTVDKQGFEALTVDQLKATLSYVGKNDLHKALGISLLPEECVDLENISLLPMSDEAIKLCKVKNVTGNKKALSALRWKYALYVWNTWTPKLLTKSRMVPFNTKEKAKPQLKVVEKFKEQVDMENLESVRSFMLWALESVRTHGIELAFDHVNVEGKSYSEVVKKSLSPPSPKSNPQNAKKSLGEQTSSPPQSEDEEEEEEQVQPKVKSISSPSKKETAAHRRAKQSKSKMVKDADLNAGKSTVKKANPIREKNVPRIAAYGISDAEKTELRKALSLTSGVRTPAWAVTGFATNPKNFLKDLKSGKVSKDSFSKWRQEQLRAPKEGPSVTWADTKVKYKGVGLYIKPRTPQEKAFRKAYDQIKKRDKSVRLPKLAIHPEDSKFKKSASRQDQVPKSRKPETAIPQPSSEDALIGLLSKVLKAFLK
jgi:hypothetical protein